MRRIIKESKETFKGGGYMFIVSIVAMVSWEYTYVSCHQIICLKYMQFIVGQLYLNIAVKHKTKFCG